MNLKDLYADYYLKSEVEYELYRLKNESQYLQGKILQFRIILKNQQLKSLFNKGLEELVLFGETEYHFEDLKDNELVKLYDEHFEINVLSKGRIEGKDDKDRDSV